MHNASSQKGSAHHIFSTILVLTITFSIFAGFSSQVQTIGAITSDIYPDWRLVIDGAVGTPLSLSLNDLAAMPREEVNGAIYCGISMVASGNWGGVKLGYLLERAAVDVAAKNLEFQADDGYAINVSVEVALQQSLIVAYDLDGQPLVEVLRLALPGYPGNFWISTIKRITVTMSTNYNIGANYYTAQMGGSHSETVPTPKPIPTPKSTPFRLPTFAPVQQSTLTPQQTLATSPIASPTPTLYPSSTPAQIETPLSNTTSLQLLTRQQTSDFRSDLSNYVYPIIVAIFCISVTIFTIRRKKRKIEKLPTD